MPEWVKTGSIITMLEESGVCYFDKTEGGSVQCGQVEGFGQVVLYPEMLRHLARELNQLADEVDSE